MIHAFTIDLEDWYHQIGTDNPQLDKSNWDNLESRVYESTHVLLDLLEKYNTKATFFILGYIAEKNPSLIDAIARKGHEIASHGYYHDTVYSLSPDQFSKDIFKTKSLLESITGNEVLGYRAPSFSIMEETEWAYEELKKAGYKYSSSVFPSFRSNGGWQNYKKKINKNKPNGKVKEYPIVLPDGFMKFLSPVGGGYFRMLPRMLYDLYLQNIESSSIFYIHPRDIDIGQPKINNGFIRNIRAYSGIKSSKKKIEYLLKKYSWGRMIDVYPDINKVLKHY